MCFGRNLMGVEGEGVLNSFDFLCTFDFILCLSFWGLCSKDPFLLG